MNVFITTGIHVRHTYLLAQAFEKFGDAIYGIILQTPRQETHKPCAERRIPRGLPEKWMKLNYVIQSKRIALAERITFRTDQAELKKRMEKCPSIETTNINSKKSVAFIRKLSPDMLIVFGGRIIKPEVIRLFPKGILNLHLGLSPEYKGSNCIEWPLYHGNPEGVGATVHYIDKGIDSGAIIDQFKTQPKPGESLSSVLMRSLQGGINLLLDTFCRIENGEHVKSENQEKTGFCYFTKHFTKEIRYGAAKRTQKKKSNLRGRLGAKVRRELSEVLRIRQSYRHFFPHLPYPAILLYHDIGDKQSPYLKHCDLSISKKRFKEHLEILQEFYKIVSIRDVYDACEKGDRLEDTIAITFDDGYKGMLDGFAVLEEDGCPATGYINSAFASSHDSFWRNKLSYLVEKNHIPELKTVLDETLGHKVVISNATVFAWTKQRILDPRIERSVSKVFSDYGDECWSGIYATWEDLLGTNRNHFTFGNHTVSHLNLTSLASDQKEVQILEGKRKLFQMLGDDRVGFSIPNGEPIHYDAQVIKIAEREHGFYLTAYGGLNVVGLNREIKRIGIPDVDACQLPRILWENL